MAHSGPKKHKAHKTVVAKPIEHLDPYRTMHGHMSWYEPGVGDDSGGEKTASGDFYNRREPRIALRTSEYKRSGPGYYFVEAKAPDGHIEKFIAYADDNGPFDKKGQRVADANTVIRDRLKFKKQGVLDDVTIKRLRGNNWKAAFLDSNTTYADVVAGRTTALAQAAPTPAKPKIPSTGGAVPQPERVVNAAVQPPPPFAVEGKSDAAPVTVSTRSAPPASANANSERFNTLQNMRKNPLLQKLMDKGELFKYVEAMSGNNEYGISRRNLKEFQAQLNKAGLRDGKGKEISVDGRVGAQMKELAQKLKSETETLQVAINKERPAGQKIKVDKRFGSDTAKFGTPVLSNPKFAGL